MLFRGSDRYASEEIDQIFDAMGAEINAGTDKEATSLYTRALDRHLSRAFDVMSDMVFRPRLGELDAERQVVLEEIAMYEDDPQERVFDVLGEAIFGSHPLGRAVIGKAEVIGATTRDQLAAFHREHYRPERIVIAAAGSVDHDALVGMAGALDAPRAIDSPAVAERATEAAAGAVEANGAAGRPAAGAGAGNGGAPGFAPGVRFLAKDTEQYHVCVGRALPCACWKASLAPPPPHGSSSRYASAGDWRTRSSPSPTSTPARGRSGCTSAPARRPSRRRCR
jgi:hypothetical protein